MFTTVYLLVVMLVVQCINIWVSVGFIVIYTVYVIVVVCQSSMAKGNDEEEENAQDAMKFYEIA